jgi:hypothetical protein
MCLIIEQIFTASDRRTLLVEEYYCQFHHPVVGIYVLLSAPPAAGDGFYHLRYWQGGSRTHYLLISFWVNQDLQ